MNLFKYSYCPQGDNGARVGGNPDIQTTFANPPVLPSKQFPQPQLSSIWSDVACHIGDAQDHSTEGDVVKSVADCWTEITSEARF